MLSKCFEVPTRVALVLCLWVCSSSFTFAQVAASPGEAMRAVGEVRSVEFIVKSTGHNAKEGLTYLNSEQNHKWNTNFAVVVGKADAGRFVAAGGVAGLEKFYLGKQVQVSGKVEKFKAVTGIRATGPDERQAGARPTRSSADAR